MRASPVRASLGPLRPFVGAAAGWGSPTLGRAGLVRRPGLPFVPLAAAAALIASLAFTTQLGGSDVSPRQADARTPLAFEANQGQTSGRVDFLARGPGFTMFLTPREAVLSLLDRGEGATAVRQSVLRMQLSGASADAVASGRQRLPGKVNYLVGKPADWRTGVPTYGQVAYSGVYPGIDLVYHGSRGALEYDFVVAPGADPKAIALRFSGAERMTLDAKGNLVLRTKAGTLQQQSPRLYQSVDGTRRAVQGGFVLKGQTITFSVGAYDRSRPLVIDPTLSYSSYLGGGSRAGVLGNGTDFGFGVAADASGNAYVGGQTAAASFPVKGAYQATKRGETDAYVAKFNPNASGSNSLVYATYIGGDRQESGWDIGVDSAGNAYLAGSTNSGEDPGTVVTEAPFPTTANAYDGTCGTDGACNTDIPSDFFQEDDPGTPDVNEAGTCPPSVFPAGCPTLGKTDTFLTKLNAAGNGLLYSTFLGGSDFDQAASETALPGHMGIAVVGTKAYVTASTGSPDFPTKNAFDSSCGSDNDPSCDGGNVDSFLAVIDTSQSGAGSLSYSTYLGGVGSDEAKSVAVDPTGNAYVAGTTFPDEDGNDDFPTKSALQGSYRGGVSDGFVTRINPSASGAASLVYSTFLGGGGKDESWAVATEGGGTMGGSKAYVTGFTDSGDNPATAVADGPTPYFPTTVGAYDTTFNGQATDYDVGSTDFLNGDAYVTKLNGSGKDLAYSTFLGGKDGDTGTGIAVDRLGQAYVTGYTTCETTGSTGGVPDPNGHNTTPEDTSRDPSGIDDCTGTFPTKNAVQPNMSGWFLGTAQHNSPTDVFVTRLGAGGTKLSYSTFLGGIGFDRGFAIAVRDTDASGKALAAPEAFVTGRVQIGYPTTPNAFQTLYDAGVNTQAGNGRDSVLSRITG